MLLVEKGSTTQDMVAPTNVKELRLLLGVVSCYRRFVSEFATLAHPLKSQLK